MSQKEPFLNRVQVELDAGRDPLDCPSLIVWLEEHPEDLETFVNLRAVCSQLAASAAAPAFTAAAASSAVISPKIRTWWKPLTAFASAAALLMIYSLYAQKSSPQSDPPRTTAAILLTHEVSTQRNFSFDHSAPADSNSGAVVLSMSSSQSRSQY